MSFFKRNKSFKSRVKDLEEKVAIFINLLENPGIRKKKTFTGKNKEDFSGYIMDLEKSLYVLIKDVKSLVDIAIGDERTFYDNMSLVMENVERIIVALEGVEREE